MSTNPKKPFEITTLTTHKLTFKVESFIPTEGGMDQDQFGKDQYTLTDAIHLLEIARSQANGDFWVITVYVDTVVR